MDAQRWYVRVTTVDGDQVYWHKAGRRHSLSPELGPVWVREFKPAVFQVLPDGRFVPRGSDPRAVDVARVELEPAEPPQP